MQFSGVEIVVVPIGDPVTILVMGKWRVVVDLLLFLKADSVLLVLLLLFLIVVRYHIDVGEMLK